MPGNAEQPVNGIHWNLTNPSTGQSHKYHYAGVTAQTAFPHYSSPARFFRSGYVSVMAPYSAIRIRYLIIKDRDDNQRKQKRDA